MEFVKFDRDVALRIVDEIESYCGFMEQYITQIRQANIPNWKDGQESKYLRKRDEIIQKMQADVKWFREYKTGLLERIKKVVA